MAISHVAKPNTTADILYDAFVCGAYGGSTVAVFFLIVDALNGQPLFTPSLLGSVLFQGMAAEAVTEVSLTMVASYTVVHFAVFALLGAGIAIVVDEVEMHAHHPVWVLLIIFAIFELGFGAASAVLMPHLIARVGPAEVAIANLLGAAAIVTYLAKFRHPRREDETPTPSS